LAVLNKLPREKRKREGQPSWSYIIGSFHILAMGDIRRGGGAWGGAAERKQESISKAPETGSKQ